MLFCVKPLLWLHGMSDENKTTEQRLETLESLAKSLMSRAVAWEQRLLERSAENMALHEALVVLVDHLKLDRKSFLTSFENRKKYYHDLFLRAAENVDPALAALLDDRRPEDVSDISDDEGFPGGKPPLP